MKNSTLIRIKVPKALYESALRKALLEASDSKKATPENKKDSIFKREKEENKKMDDMIAKARAAKAKTGVKEARHISDFIALKPGREISKDTQHLGEKKKHKGVSGTMDQSKGINEAKKKVDPKKAAEEKKKKEAEDKKKKEVEAKKAADKKKVADAKKK